MASEDDDYRHLEFLEEKALDNEEEVYQRDEVKANIRRSQLLETELQVERDVALLKENDCMEAF